jgi:aspartate aminotransferase-like enzyme
MTPRGRHVFANPGPTNIPDSIHHAIAHHSVDFMGADFLEVHDACVAGLKRVLRTGEHLFMYAGSGHAAWEATLTNLLSPGDRILVIETGNFSEGRSKMAGDLGIEVQTLPADWRRGVEHAALRAALAADGAHAIKAVCAVHNETSTGVTLDLPRIRALLDETGHPALFLVDTISSFGSLDYRHDEWGVDAAVGGSQKGLMLPVGFSFTAVSDKAMEAHARAPAEALLQLGRDAAAPPRRDDERRPRRRARAAEWHGLPHRPSRRPQRTDDPRHARRDRGRPAPASHPACARRRGGGGRIPGRDGRLIRTERIARCPAASSTSA